MPPVSVEQRHSAAAVQNFACTFDNMRVSRSGSDFHNKTNTSHPESDFALLDDASVAGAPARPCASIEVPTRLQPAAVASSLGRWPRGFLGYAPFAVVARSCARVSLAFEVRAVRESAFPRLPRCSNSVKPFITDTRPHKEIVRVSQQVNGVSSNANEEDCF